MNILPKNSQQLDTITYMYKNLVYTKILKSIKASKVIYDNVIVHLAGRGRGKEQGDGAGTSNLHGNQQDFRWEKQVLTCFLDTKTII